MPYFNGPAEVTNSIFDGDFDLAGYQWVTLAAGTSLTFDVYIKGRFSDYEDSVGAAQSDFSITIRETQVLLTVDSCVKEIPHFDSWVVKHWDGTGCAEESLRRLWPLLDPNFKDPEEFILERLSEVEFLSGLVTGNSASWCPTEGVREELPHMDFTFSSIIGEPA